VQRYQTIEAMKKEHTLTALCAAFEVKRSGYLTWCKSPASDRERTDALLTGQIEVVHAKHKGRYGAPRIQDELVGQGQRHGVKRIARLMKAAGLQGLCSRRYVPQTTDSDHDHPIAPNLLASAPAPTRLNQTWVTDLTYVRTEEGWLYVAVMLDLWSRRVVGWATGATLHASLAQRALQMAIQHRRPGKGLLHHSDRGVQYASGEYREQLKAAGLEPSMSRKGNPYDNAAMESFNATYKRECVGLAEARGGYATRSEATSDFFDYVEKYYNRERRHSALGYQTPVDFENQLN
jgi:putative transposase